MPPDADGRRWRKTKFDSASRTDPLFQAVQTAPVLQPGAAGQRDRGSQQHGPGDRLRSLELHLDRNQLAMRWRQIADDFGYSNDAAVDDRPLGRSARVGEGMILLESEVKA